MNSARNGIARLNRTLEARSHKIANFHSKQQNFMGTIVADGLKLDVFPAVIPHGSYFICRSLCQPVSNWTTVEGNLETVKLPKSLFPLQVGDRVLVALADGLEFAVVDIVEEG
jgi:hypothetical protein